MTEMQFRLLDAFKLVLDKRSIVYPNYGFQKQLKRLEVKLGMISQEEFEKESEKTTFYLDSIYD